MIMFKVMDLFRFKPGIDRDSSQCQHQIEAKEMICASVIEALIEFLDKRFFAASMQKCSRSASVSNVALASKVNLNTSACLRRVERLKQEGLILRVVALLNPQAIDTEMLIMIGVVLDRSTPGSCAAFEKAAFKVPGYMECHVVTGEFDYFLLLHRKNSESYNKLHAEKLLYL